ncbi:hypothetical protein [Komagataeibacter xylinus]|nr:hypothetical protein [Komagataeibacter xylinus]
MKYLWPERLVLVVERAGGACAAWNHAPQSMGAGHMGGYGMRLVME